MGQPEPARQVIRFGVFEVDLQASELRKQGLRVKLQEKPLQVLAILLERPSKVVTREELQQRLWPDVNVDFEHSLSTAIKKLRDALDDAADNPRFIETRPGRGYRFIYPIEGLERRRWPQIRAWQAWLAAIAVVVLVAGLVGLNVAGLRDRLLGGAAPGQITSLVVLPLDNMMGDTEQDYFVEGMHEALITNLSKIGALKVISLTSAMRYKDTDKPLPQIARELGVDAVLEGSVLRTGNQVRITVQLIEAATERYLWAESYERDLTDILALQSEVARAIAREIKVAVTPVEETRLARARPVNPEAYEAYLKGHYHTNKMTLEGFLQGIEYYEQAIQKDPDYALAYASLAHSYGMLVVLESVPASEGTRKARAATWKAFELDPTLAEVQINLADFKFNVDWDWRGGEAGFRRAVELDPGSADAVFHYALCLRTQGRHDEAIRMMERARQLDPLSLWINQALGVAFYRARQEERAIEQYRKTIELEPKSASTYTFLGNVYESLGSYEEAAAAYLKARSLAGDSTERVQALQDAYRASGIRGYWRKRLEHLKEAAKRKHVSPATFASFYARLGEKDQALAWLEKAYQQRDSRLASLKARRVWDPLRSDPRFQDLVRRMNFPED